MKTKDGIIHFNLPPYIGTEEKYIKDVLEEHKLSGDGKYTKKCCSWFEDRFNINKVLLTTSGSTALDMALLLCNLNPGDEVILPSYTFSSTANAAVLSGAKLVFVDVRPDTMNIDETKIESAITDKTKAIIVMHYAGVSCEMDAIMDIAHQYNLKVVEDAAQGVMSEYKGRALGTIGDFGCFSFHETKNFSMGEGGAILINNPKDIERAEILREKGTNRSKFFRREVDKYTWIDFGDSYLPSELNAAYLWAQLECADKIQKRRMNIWNTYKKVMEKYADNGLVDLQVIPDGVRHNAHMFYVKLKNIDERTEFINYFKERHVLTPFHYIPLHSAPAGTKYGRFNGKDLYTTRESMRIVRLPLFFNLDDDDLQIICTLLCSFFSN